MAYPLAAEKKVTITFKAASAHYTSYNMLYQIDASSVLSIAEVKSLITDENDIGVYNPTTSSLCNKVVKIDLINDILLVYFDAPMIADIDNVFELIFGSSLGIANSTEAFYGYENYWGFNDFTPSYLSIDEMGKNNAVIGSAALVDSVNGYSAFSTHISALGSNISCGDVEALNLATKFTFEFLRYYGEGVQGVDIILEKYKDAYHTLSLEMGYAASYLRFYNTTTGYAWYDLSYTTGFHHCVIVFDGAETDNADKLKFYSDGIQQTLNFVGGIPFEIADLAGSVMYINKSPYINHNDELGLLSVCKTEDWASTRTAMLLTPDISWEIAYEAVTLGGNETIIGAIKIYLGQSYTDDTDLGLYDSELRFSEAELFGVDDTYNYQMLLRNGIGEIAEEFDDTLGGNNVTINDFTFSIKGTNQFFLKLQELGIQLSGKYVEYIEFIGTDTDSDATSETVMFAGVIENYSYNEFGCDITAKTSFADGRKKCLGRTLTTAEYTDLDTESAGETDTVTFGRSDPDNSIFFCLKRVEYKDTLITNNDIFSSSVEPSYLSNFPVVGDILDSGAYSYYVDPNYIQFLLTEESSGVPDATILATYLAANAAGKYIKLTDTDSEQSDIEGAMRRIKSAAHIYVDSTRLMVKLELHEFLPEVIEGCHPLNPFPALPTEFPSHLELHDITVRYALDWKSSECFGTGFQEFYVKDNTDMVRCTDVGISQTDSDVPVYDIRSDVYTGEIGDAHSFKILPLESLVPYLSPTGNFDAYAGGAGYDHPHDGSSDDIAGVFVQNGSGTVCNTQGVITGDGNYKDRDYTTQYLFETHFTLAYPVDHFDYWIAFILTLPEIDDSVIFDNVYLGLRLRSSTTDDSTDPKLTLASKFLIAHHPYYGSIEKVVEQTSMNFEDIVDIESLPDSYYSNSPDTDNKEFYWERETGSYLTGYKLFDLNITTKEKYRNLHEVIIGLWRHSEQIGIASFIDDNVAIYEAAIIFEKNVSIDTEVYA